ncbi:MAG TPA: NUDIX domain-containing protein [Microlunatus sp.]|nr:NUDIX domain-containing protein [Microlunatus sp.]
MGQRFDYFDDPDAPPANSVKPSAAAFVRHGNHVLLACRADNGNWSMPGGAHDPGESLSQTAIRETLEETGIAVRLTGVAGIYTDPRHVIHYTSNDEVRQEFTIVYRADYVSGEPATSSETTRVEWVPVDKIADLPMDRSQRMRVDWATSQTGTWIDPTGD